MSDSTKCTEAFNKLLSEQYPKLDASMMQDNNEGFKYLSESVEVLWLAFEFGWNESRKQALQDVAEGFISQKSWTHDVAFSVVEHAAQEGAEK